MIPIKNTVHRGSAIPMGIFPKKMRKHICNVAEAMNCSIDYVAAATLVLSSVVIGGATKIKIKEGWLEGAVLFVIIVGEPGSKKTPAINSILGVLKKLQREAPEDTTFITTDATPEALAQLLFSNKFLLLYKDEIWSLFGGMDQYKSKGGNEMEFYLSIWSQTLMIIHRKDKPKIQIDNPFMSIIGGIQDDLLQDFGKLKSNGIKERWLTVYPARTRVRSTDAEISPEDQELFEKVFFDIYNYQKNVDESVIELSEEAKRVWKKWHTDYCERQNEDDVPYYMRSFYSKMEAYTARFALLLEFMHQFSNGNNVTNISPQSITNAILLNEYFLSHADKAFESYHSTNEEKKVARAVMWFRKQKNGTAPIRKVYTNRVGGCTNYREALDLLLEMRSRGLGRMVESNENMAGGPKGFTFYLDPKYLATINTENNG